jgi:hypothetical protein
MKEVRIPRGREKGLVLVHPSETCKEPGIAREPCGQWALINGGVGALELPIADGDLEITAIAVDRSCQVTLQPPAVFPAGRMVR